MLSLPFTFVAGLMSWTLIARGMQRRLIPIVAGTLTLNLVLNIALVPAYSYKASASVTLAVEILGAVVLVIVVRRWLGVGPALRSTVRVALAGAVALGAGALVAALAGAAAGTVAATAAFAVLVLAFRLVTGAELDALVRRR